MDDLEHSQQDEEIEDDNPEEMQALGLMAAYGAIDGCRGEAIRNVTGYYLKDFSGETPGYVLVREPSKAQAVRELSVRIRNYDIQLNEIMDSNEPADSLEIYELELRKSEAIANLRMIRHGFYNLSVFSHARYADEIGEIDFGGILSDPGSMPKNIRSAPVCDAYTNCGIDEKLAKAFYRANHPDEMMLDFTHDIPTDQALRYLECEKGRCINAIRNLKKSVKRGDIKPGNLDKCKMKIRNTRRKLSVILSDIRRLEDEALSYSANEMMQKYKDDGFFEQLGKADTPVVSYCGYEVNDNARPEVECMKKHK